MSREYPKAPIAGVGAVILAIDKRRVVLIRRGQEPLKGAWSLPGGAVELGETLQEAIVREVLEETGLMVKPIRILKAFDRIHRDSEGQVRYHYVLVDFLCHAFEGTLLAGSDAAEVCWADVEDLARFALAPLTADIIRQGIEDMERA
ncbi:MAG TPA: NUDIX hydrolase [Acidobacteriaceae bacterium]|nr:NUDIX hydrolase [Acidobacteriaceae bacterium]